MSCCGWMSCGIIPWSPVFLRGMRNKKGLPCPFENTFTLSNSGLCVFPKAAYLSSAVLSSAASLLCRCCVAPISFPFPPLPRRCVWCLWLECVCSSPSDRPQLQRSSVSGRRRMLDRQGFCRWPLVLQGLCSLVLPVPRSAGCLSPPAVGLSPLRLFVLPGRLLPGSVAV